MSRVDAVRIAVEKAQAAQPALLSGAVLASDAFFPFADGPARGRSRRHRDHLARRVRARRRGRRRRRAGRRRDGRDRRAALPPAGRSSLSRASRLPSFPAHECRVHRVVVSRPAVLTRAPSSQACAFASALRQAIRDEAWLKSAVSGCIVERALTRHVREKSVCSDSTHTTGEGPYAAHAEHHEALPRHRRAADGDEPSRTRTTRRRSGHGRGRHRHRGFGGGEGGFGGFGGFGGGFGPAAAGRAGAGARRAAATSARPRCCCSPRSRERLPDHAGGRAALRRRLAPEPRLRLPGASAARGRGPDPLAGRRRAQLFELTDDGRAHVRSVASESPRRGSR